MFISLDVLTFARKVHDWTHGTGIHGKRSIGKPIPKEWFEEHCAWLYGSTDGYQIYLDAVVPSWILAQTRTFVDAFLPDGVIIDDANYTVHFPRLRDVFEGIFQILRGVCMVHRLKGFFEDHYGVFETCVSRIDEIIVMEDMIHELKKHTIKIKSSRPPRTTNPMLSSIPQVIKL